MTIFVPKAAPRAKIAQLLTFGAEVLAVDGTYDQAFDLCLEATRRFGWYNRNTGFNPFTREGKKSVSFEICEQLGWKAPDFVEASITRFAQAARGEGTVLATGAFGLRNLELQLGLLERAARP